MTYSDKLEDPRWQKKRLEILNRDDFTCQHCFTENKTLHVHHIAYFDGDPWEIDNSLLLTLCNGCHNNEEINLKHSWQTLQKSLKNKGFTSTHIEYLSIFINRIDITIDAGKVKDIYSRLKSNEDDIEEKLKAIIQHF